jgi:hypothetical protein
MSPLMWALIVVVVIVVVALAALFASRRRTASLQKRYGPEYDRTVESATGRRAAEAQLEDRSERRDRLEIRPLPEAVRLRYAEQWRGVQERFVDQPSEALSAGESLLTHVMQERGYPVSDFDEQADLVSVDHPDVVENYRVADGILQRNKVHQASTEDLREALLRYRSLFDVLLRADVPSPALGDATSATTTPRQSQP